MSVVLESSQAPKNEPTSVSAAKNSRHRSLRHSQGCSYACLAKARASIVASCEHRNTCTHAESSSRCLGESTQVGLKAGPYDTRLLTIPPDGIHALHRASRSTTAALASLLPWSSTVAQRASTPEPQNADSEGVVPWMQPASSKMEGFPTLKRRIAGTAG